MTIEEKKAKLRQILEDGTSTKLARLDRVLELFNDHLEEVRGDEPNKMILLSARINGFKRKIKFEALTPVEEKAETGRIMILLDSYLKSDRCFLKEISEITYTGETKWSAFSIVVYVIGGAFLLSFLYLFFNWSF